MCYSNCPYEGNFSGECSNAIKNSLNFDAHCNTDFECEVCGDICREEDIGTEGDICIACDIEYKLEIEAENKVLTSETK